MSRQTLPSRHPDGPRAVPPAIRAFSVMLGLRGPDAAEFRRLGECLTIGDESADRLVEWMHAAGMKRTRLIHAMVRRHVVAMPDWDNGVWGLPVNQTDMAATLVGALIAPSAGGAGLGIVNRPKEYEAVAHLTRYVGWLIGVRDEFLPAFPVSVTAPPPADVATTTTLAGPGTVDPNTPVVLKATVDPTTAKGRVQFKLGNAALGAPVEVVDGVATLPTTFLNPGTYSVTAEFTGAAGFTESSSQPQTVTVSGKATPPGGGGTGSLGNLGLGNLFGSSK